MRDDETDGLSATESDYCTDGIREPCASQIRAAVGRHDRLNKKVNAQLHRQELAEQRVGFIIESVKEVKSLLKWVLAVVVGGGALQTYTTLQIATASAAHSSSSAPTSNANSVRIGEANTGTRAAPAGDKGGQPTTPGGDRRSDPPPHSRPIPTAHHHGRPYWLAARPPDDLVE